MAVQVLAGSVTPHRCTGIGVRAAICTSRRSAPAPGMVVTCVAEHVRMCSRGALEAGQLGPADGLLPVRQRVDVGINALVSGVCHG